MEHPGSLKHLGHRRGNLVSNIQLGETLLYSWDDENQLTSVRVDPASSPAFQPWRIDFVYDGLRRLRRTLQFTWNGSAWTSQGEVRYLYDGMLIVQERNSSNTPQVHYSRGLDLSGTLHGAGGIGGLLMRSHGYSAGNWSNHNAYHSDANGNVTALVNSSGVLQASHKYNPYGGLISSSGTLASANTMRFSSKPAIFSSSGAWGFYYYGYRFYDPVNQRWLNRDPIEEAGGTNLYGFCLNSPLYWVDPYGLHWTDHIPDAAIAPGTINFFAGMGDNLSLGLTDHARDWMDVNDAVNKCAGAYTAGQWTGEALQTAIGGAAGFKAAGKAVKGVTEYSHWIPARLLPGGRGGLLDRATRAAKLNGNYVTKQRHYLHDPHRDPIKKAEALEKWGEKWNPALQQLDRIPRFPAGSVIAAAAGDLSRRGQSEDCN